MNSIEGFSTADVLKDALERVGVNAPTAQDVDSARRSLFLVLQGWQAQRLPTWRTGTIDHQFGAATASLPLTAGMHAGGLVVDDIVLCEASLNAGADPGHYVDMARLTRIDFESRVVPETAQRPTAWYLERGAEPVLKLYPTADTDRHLRIHAVMRPSTFDRASDPDAPPGRWLAALVASVAADLAAKIPGIPEPRIQRLEAKAAKLTADAQYGDRERAPLRIRTR